MKKRFLSKSLIAKIALVIVIILVFEFAMAEPVAATEAVGQLGGTLLRPIVNLVVYLADGVINILQSALLSMETSFQYIDLTDEGGPIGTLKKIGKWTLAIVLVGAVVVGMILGAPIMLATGATGAIVSSTTGIVACVAAGLGAGGFICYVAYPFVHAAYEVMFGNSFTYANIAVEPGSILRNEIAFFNINFFKDIQVDEEGTTSLIMTLRTIVSHVYVTIRDICLVAMLIVMIYVAIRALIALSPKEKSRYKENFVNCLVGMILIVSAHFIMSISVTLVDMISSGIATAAGDVQINDNAGNLSESEVKDMAEANKESVQTIGGASITVGGEKIYKALEDAGYPNVTFTSEPSWWQKALDMIPFVNYDDEYVVSIQCSSFTEQARYMCQEIYDVNEDGERTNENWNYIGWSLVYVMFVILTVAFVWLYGRRVFYMAALTMFAPIIGVMYPINRVNGSRAQTLNLWFKEYMGNLLMQPFHLFLYTIFVGSAMEFAINSPIFAIIALVGILFVEKILKDMLGIQDTRIGGLGKALQDTNRAIKTAERTTASVAKGIGRAASRGAHGLIGAYENYRNGSEEIEEANKKPREQNMPVEGPIEVLSGEVEDPSVPNAPLSTDVRRNGNAQVLEDFIDVPYREVSSEPLEDPNSSEEAILPENDPLRLEMKDDDVAEGAAALNAEEDDTTIALNDQDNLIDDDDMSTQDLRELPGFLEPETLDMLDELNGNVANIDFDTFNSQDVLEEANSKPLLNSNYNEEVIKSDGERKIYRNKDNGKLRLEREDTPDYNPPMSVAMAAGSEARSINVGADRTMEFDNSLEGTPRENLRGGNSNRASQLGGNSNNVTSYRNLGNSQVIPDDNNVRSRMKNDTSSVHDSLNVWTNPNEPLPSSNERPEMKVLDGGRSVNAKIPNDIETNNIDTQDVKIMSGNDRSTNNVPILDEPSARTETFDNTNNNVRAETVDNTRNDINVGNIPDNNISISNTGTSSNANTTFNNSNSENIHRLREDEYKELPPSNSRMQETNSSTTASETRRISNNTSSGNIGTNNNTSNIGLNTNNANSTGSNNNAVNAGTNNNTSNIGLNTNNANSTGSNNNASNTRANNNASNTPTSNNTNNTTTNTQDSQGSNNQSSNNEEREPEKYEATTARKVIGGAETVVGRTAGVVGTAVSGVVDVATSTLSGDIGGAIESGVNSTIDSVNIATGSPSRSSSRSRTPSNSEKTTQSSKNLTSEAETVMKNANVSEAEAIALAEACKALKINDDRNMVLIAKVYKGADSADRNKVVELSKMLHRMKEEGKSKGDAEKALENQNVSTTTKELLIKMYKDLHI